MESFPSRRTHIFDPSHTVVKKKKKKDEKRYCGNSDVNESTFADFAR